MFKGTFTEEIKILSSTVLVNIQNYAMFFSFTTSVLVSVLQTISAGSEHKLGILSAEYTP